MKSLEKFFLREEKREGESEEEYKLGSLYINNWSNKQTKNMKKKIKFVKLFASIYYYIYIYTGGTNRSYKYCIVAIINCRGF